MNYQPAIASMSLGRAWVHAMPEKLQCAAEAGFKGVEIFYEDLEYMAKHMGGVTDENLYEAAKAVKTLCDDNNLAVIGLQPFLFYEGLTDRREHEARIQKLMVWFRLVQILGTDLIQIPSNFLRDGITDDMEVIVSDMRKVADLGLTQRPVVRFAYESLAWGTVIDTWELMWEVVKRVDRPNFGCCLDTFNIAGRVWADPASPTGQVSNADADLKESIERLIRTVDLKKVFYVQVVDAERMETPLIEGHPFYVPDQPARMSWSRNARLFMFEEDRGGYLPVVKIARSIFERLGYQGWVSMELFSRTMSDPNKDVPRMHAQRGMKSWQKLVETLGLS